MEMNTKSLVAAIDEELSRLEQVRRILAGAAAAGRTANGANGAGGRRRPKLSAAGRARIAAAQRKRWAKRRKTAKKQATTKA